ncbi:MAG: YkgJ family cysteine cluster protein, partial [Halobacteriales archaeon]|nr:YkgJ family cysteine cluster protein [Halobacteriales archaeon]
MEVNCEGCAGCCVDWRAIAPDPVDHERRGPRDPLDDRYNLVPLSREDVRELLAAGLADATVPRLWHDDASTITIDGYQVAAVDGKPVFFLGLRQPPKPVGPFGTEPRWLPTCIFLDPKTLQCRVHDSALFPEECATYPGQNLDLGAETECERVEDAFGDERLLNESPPDDLPPPRFGPGAVGHRLFVHPDPDRLDGVVDRVRSGTITGADRAEFVAAAVAGSPGTTATELNRFQTARE